MRLSSTKIWKNVIFSQKKAFAIFREMELFFFFKKNGIFPSSKKYKKTHSKKVSYISGNGIF